jgi:hypothetical protein
MSDFLKFMISSCALASAAAMQIAVVDAGIRLVIILDWERAKANA